jgi:predicted nucleic acid-binding protein
MRLVLDASVLVQFVADEEDARFLDHLVVDHELHIPAICDVEVVGGLARHVRSGSASSATARDALIGYVSLPLIRHLHLGLVARTYELTANFSAADASYVALAEALDARLVTVDAALRRAVRSHTSVELVPGP